MPISKLSSASGTEYAFTVTALALPYRSANWIMYVFMVSLLSRSPLADIPADEMSRRYHESGIDLAGLFLGDAK